MPANDRKIFFRGTAEEAWQWRERSTKRKTTVDALIREAADLYALIPADRLDEVRALIVDTVKAPRDAKATHKRAIMAESDEEAELLRAVAKILKSGREPECSLLRTMVKR